MRLLWIIILSTITTQLGLVLLLQLVHNSFICKYMFVLLDEGSAINWIQENTIISNKFIFSFSLFSRRSTKRFRLKVNCNYNINTQQRINKKRGKMSPKNGAFFQISFSVCFSSCLTLSVDKNERIHLNVGTTYWSYLSHPSPSIQPILLLVDYVFLLSNSLFNVR